MCYSSGSNRYMYFVATHLCLWPIQFCHTCKYTYAEAPKCVKYGHTHMDDTTAVCSRTQNNRNNWIRIKIFAALTIRVLSEPVLSNCLGLRFNISTLSSLWWLLFWIGKLNCTPVTVTSSSFQNIQLIPATAWQFRFGWTIYALILLKAIASCLSLTDIEASCSLCQY